MKYLLKFIFPFLRSGVEVKRGVEFCHSIRKASRIRQKVGTECLNTRFPLPTLLWAGYSVKSNLFILFYEHLIHEVNCNVSSTRGCCSFWPFIQFILKFSFSLKFKLLPLLAATLNQHETNERKISTSK